jgi:tRNA A-37 threonylcarbamoyl transferase component Bud32
MRRVVGPADHFSPGTRIGDYVIERTIEEELGEAYEASHTILPRLARLDVMQTIFVGLRPVADRMLREACVIESLRHPGVPRIYNVGMLADDRPWVASELIDGVPLSASNQPLPAADVIGLLRDVTAILAYTHERGVAHRSIAPEAIVCDNIERGTPVCLVQWNRVLLADDDRAVACADDMFALALVLEARIEDPVPVALTRLLLEMMAPEPENRPSAARVNARARVMQEALPILAPTPWPLERTRDTSIPKPRT